MSTLLLLLYTYLTVVLLMGCPGQAIDFVSPPKPDNCRYTKEGTYYRGTQTMANSGNTCRMWSQYSDEVTSGDFGGESVAKVRLLT